MLSFSLRDPGNFKGCRFFHLQSILDDLDGAEQRDRKNPEVTDSQAPLPGAPSPPLKGKTVVLSTALTRGGNKYLIGVFATEARSVLASQREITQRRKVCIKPHIIG